MTSEPEEQPRILVAQTAFLGDVILATPLVRAARRLYPGAYLAFLSTPAGAGLVRGLEGVDEVVAYDKHGREKGLAGLRAKAAELAGRKFDLAICAHRSVRSALLLRLAGIRRRIGFANSAWPWLFTDRVPREGSRHEVERNLALLGPLGGAPSAFDPRLALPKAAAPSDLLGPPDGSLRVGLCPGSVWTTKRWPARGFAELARSLHSDLGASIHLLGSEADGEAAREVEERSGVPVHNLTGRTNLREWMGAIAAMDLVVTNDSSPTHIACAVRTPVVTVFGATTPGQGFAPWLSPSRVVEVSGLGCRPCGEHGGRRCPEGHFKCMELIDPPRVAAAVKGLLAEVRP